MEIIHQPSEHEFYTEIDGLKAYVRYTLHDGALDIKKTLVPKPLGGKGLAGALVKEAYDYAVKEHLECLATCSYAAVWLDRHPEYNGRPSADYVPGACAV